MKKHDIRVENIPSLVQIEMTYACNHKCAFCYNPKRDTKIDLERLDRIIDSVSKSMAPHVYFIGGEPSLVPLKKLNEYIEKLSKVSSVAMITNGSIRLVGLSKKIACLGIPIHGLTSEEHDGQTRVKGSFQRTVDNIKYYVSNGYDIRCVFVLTGYNYDRMYEMIRFAAELGAESVYIDRYEDGGFGASVSGELSLKPTLKQFREAVTQILKAREDFTSFKGKVGFGTAIPMCMDKRLIENNLVSICGVGTYFCAINPEGDLRLCNQSEMKFGNVLKEPLEEIWKKKDLNVYRDLSWVEEPCKSCRLLEICQCGCKVDANCSDGFCIDFAVREDRDNIIDEQIEKINKNYYGDPMSGSHELPVIDPNRYRIFSVSRYLRIHERYLDKKIVTRYQTITVDELALEMIKAIVHKNIVNEKELVDCFLEKAEEEEIRRFVSELVVAEAIEIKGEVTYP